MAPPQGLSAARRCISAMPGLWSGEHNQAFLPTAQLGYGTQSLTIFLDDVDSHFQTKAAGAKILEDLHETVYGELQYAAEDLDGHNWLFSRHARDLSPDERGAKIAHR